MSPDQTAPVPAGWYPDPYGVSEMRWWDGQSWTESVHPPAAPEPASVPLAAPAVHVEPAQTEEPTVTAEPAATAEQTTRAAQHPASAIAMPAVTPVSAAPEAPTTTQAPPSATQEPELQATAFQAPTAQAPTQTQTQTQPEHSPAPESLIPPLVSPGLAPPLAGSLLTDMESVAPSEPASKDDETAPEPGQKAPLAITSSARLPSRREMRLRKELEGEAPSSVSAFSSLGISTDPEPDSEEDIVPVEESAPASKTDSAPSALPLPVPASASASGTAPISAAAPSSSPATVPDSSTPTAFDWLPGATAGGQDAPPTTTPPRTGASAHTSLPAEPSPDTESGFPPLGTRASSTPTSTNGFSDAPTGVTDAWTRESTVISGTDDTTRSTATRKATVSGWFIAAMPLLAAVLSISAVKGRENYPAYVPLPEEVPWWMLVVAVVGVLYLVTLLLAVADSHKLDWAGYHQPAHWAWSLLTAPVYLIIRTISVKRETGRTSVLFVVWLALTAAIVAAWFGIGAFAPELLASYPLPFM